jgi:hypothetical protein
MKYDPFLKMRCNSILFWSNRVKYPLLQTKRERLPLITDLQFAVKKKLTALGEGYRSMNFPMSALSAKIIVFLLGTIVVSFGVGICSA